MNSPQRLAANRSNSLHSTGPRTPAGKHRSSLNATRHGLTSQTVIMPGEDLEAYQQFCRDYQASLNPQGVVERDIVQTLADAQWRLNRCRALEYNHYALGFEDNQAKLDTENGQAHAAMTMVFTHRDYYPALESLGRHEARLHRVYHQSLAKLQDLQASRKEREHAELRQAAAIRTHLKPSVHWDPADDGFVLSLEQVDAYIRQEKRRDRVLGAS